MKQSAEFLNDHNVLPIVEDILAQPFYHFRETWDCTIEVNGSICREVSQYCNQLLQGDDLACVEQDLPMKKLLNEKLGLLQCFAKRLWSFLIPDVQENLWLEWLKAGLVKAAEHPANAAALGEAVNA